ncbi:hypothetical protein [Roseovarius sp. TE539]|uniref:hypothetical protein n=1 Tax=Roseovarius sp. TE539 TaxID=2249812 RepID=UPI0011BF06AF|nr:hypothetical protein [Roseovarius sp. TE539]
MSNFVAVYVAAFERYRGQVVTLDDIVRATVEANLATSSGHMGSEAITRSTRADRSRDPLYNQLKMYAELFRSLGWLRSTTSSALSYTFTLLGEQVVAAGRQWRPLLGETVLGIAYPSHVLDVRGNHDVRPFATILRTMLACNDGLARDEMIVGPLSASSDRSPADMQGIAQSIMKLRESPASAKQALEALQMERGIQVTTLRNYTRWPIAILRDLGWTGKDREPYRKGNKTFEVHRLTPLGKEKAQILEEMADLRIDQVDQLPFAQKRALSRHAHFAMMERAGFDLASVSDQLQRDETARREALTTLGISNGEAILFSPFQALSIKDSSDIFPTPEAAPVGRSVQAVIDGTDIGRGSRDHLFVEPTFVESEAEAEGAEVNALKAELLSFHERHSSLRRAAQAFAESRRRDIQGQFYPLITHLLRLLGFESDYSRAGVNYQRWDACVWLHGFAVPIEIKSPTEELYLSTKAIRQAIENKVILLARGGLKTHRDLSTLIVGYQIPNERGDMSTLIDDVYATCSVPDDHIAPRRSALFMARSVLNEVRDGRSAC